MASLWSDALRRRRLLVGIQAVTLAIGIVFFSLPWLRIGGLTAATIGGVVLLCAAGAGVAGNTKAFDLERLAEFKVTAVVVTLLGLCAGALMLSDRLQAEPSFGDGRGTTALKYAAVLATATVVGQALRATRGRRAMSIVPMIVVATVLGVLTSLVRRSDQDILAALRSARSGGSVTPILDVVWRSHHVVDESLSATIRHVELRGMIVAVLVALAYGRLDTRRERIVIGLVAAIVTVTTVLLFSRVNLLTIGLTCGLAATWALRRASVAIRSVAVISSGAAIFSLGSVQLVADALLDRSTASSEERTTRVLSTIRRFPELLGLGSPATDTNGNSLASPHNMILDLLLGAGLVGGLLGAATLVIVGRLAFLSSRHAIGASSLGELMLATGTAGLTITTFLRLLAGGGGLADPVSWLALGLAIASPSGIEPRRSTPRVDSEARAGRRPVLPAQRR